MARLAKPCLGGSEMNNTRDRQEMFNALREAEASCHRRDFDTGAKIAKEIAVSSRDIDRFLCFSATGLWLSCLSRSDPKEFNSQYFNDVQSFLEEFWEFGDDPKYQSLCLGQLIETSKRFSDQRDWPRKLSCLNEIIAYVCDNRDALHWISEQQLQVWRAQAKQAEVGVARLSNETSTRIVELCFEAAELCSPASDATNEEIKRMEAQRARWRSEGYKHRAFGEMKPKVADLTIAVKNMEKAFECAIEAYDLSKEERSDNHCLYLRYWLNVFKLRQHILARQFRLAEDAIFEAVDAAQSLLSRKVRIFPNYYIDLQDIQDEVFFVRAYNLFSRGLLKFLKRSLK